MKRSRWWLWSCLPVLLIAVSGCSDFDEMKSQRSLIEANKLVQQGEERAAEKALETLVAQYPDTRASEVAQKQLFHIKRQREFRERREFAKVLDSYKQVLNGYHALYAAYPDSVAALDQGDYFFDTMYLEEITPDGYQVYLLLQNGSGYKLWSVANDKTRGYLIDSSSRVLVPFDRDDTIRQLKRDFESPSWTAKLVPLQPVSREEQPLE